MMIVRFQTGDGATTLTGFKYFWAKYVQRFNRNAHCANCLVGSYHKAFGAQMDMTQPIEFDDAIPHKYIYICGVARGRNWEKNFHLALQPQPGATAERATYNGIVVLVQGAVELPIPPLPRGYGGLDASFTTCRNFQFGVRYFSE